MGEKFDVILNQCENQLRAGQVLAAQKTLEQITRTGIPDELSTTVASLLRRVGQPMDALAVLPSGDSLKQDDEEQLIEYCLNLKEVGAVKEAEKRFNQFSKKQSAKAHMCHVHLAFCQWKHSEGLSAVEKYLLSPDLSEYEIQVGMLNKASSLIAMKQFESAAHCLAELEKACLKNKWTKLLVGHGELLSQIFIANGDLAAAKQSLVQATQYAAGEKTKELLFVKKWSAIIEAIENQSIEPIQRFRSQAQISGHWETVRALDRKSLDIKFQQYLLEKLYFGTMYPAYKHSLDKLGTLPNSYKVNRAASRILSLKDGLLEDGTSILKVGSKNHILIESLLSDFYRPIRIGEIFSQVFPDEYFDPITSRQRVHALIYRTRQWAEKYHLPIRIVEQDQSYRLTLTGELGIEKFDDKPVDRAGHHIDQLRTHFGTAPFSAKEAREHLGLSKAATHRILTQALDEQELERLGPPSKPRYKSS